jgi:hypothetical protein
VCPVHLILHDFTILITMTKSTGYEANRYALFTILLPFEEWRLLGGYAVWLL